MRMPGVRLVLISPAYTSFPRPDPTRPVACITSLGIPRSALSSLSALCSAYHEYLVPRPQDESPPFRPGDHLLINGNGYPIRLTDMQQRKDFGQCAGLRNLKIFTIDEHLYHVGMS